MISKKLRERGAQVSLQLYGLLCCYTRVRGEQRKKEITCQSLKSKSTHHLGADFKKPYWSSAQRKNPADLLDIKRVTMLPVCITFIREGKRFSSSQLIQSQSIVGKFPHCPTA